MHPMKDGLAPGVLERMVALRRDLHRHPELSWREVRTAERVSARLTELAIAHERVGETGIVADLPGATSAPRVALRADLDALPIHEETGLPFASEHDGIMHACGHDGHTSMLLGAAELLAAEPDRPAPVRFIFQPAEESGLGARRMIDGGALRDVAVIFGGHLDRHYPTGSLIVTEGPVNASTDTFHIRIDGQGAHAARPHEAIDAVVVGSLLVMALQTIVSREVDPAHPSVVTIGRFVAGTASNVIPGVAELEGTIRAQESSVREHLMRSLRRITDSVARLHDARAEISFSEGTPPLRNSAELAGVAREAAVAVVGPDGVRELVRANMGAEDFSHYLECVPGCYVRFGARVEGRESYPAHSSKFDFDEAALSTGALWYREIALVAGRRLRDGWRPQAATGASPSGS